MTDTRTTYQVQHASELGRWGTCHPTRYDPATNRDAFDDACAKAIELADKDGKPHRVVEVVSTLTVQFVCDAGHRADTMPKVLVPPAGYCNRGPCALAPDHEGACKT